MPDDRTATNRKPCCDEMMRALRTELIETADRIVCTTCWFVIKDRYGVSGVTAADGHTGLTFPPGMGPALDHPDRYYQFPKTKLSLDEESEDPCWGEFPKEAWAIPSKAVVACDGNGHGCVLWTAGPHVAQDLEDIGRDLGDIGLDGAPTGISVWEGKHQGGGYNAMTGDYNDSWLEGEFRDPTADEWIEIVLKRCPWNDADWMKKETP